MKAKAVGSVRLAELLKASTHTKGSGFELGRHRSKRSVFLHSGLKICPQETISEVVTSHQAYYQLRGMGHVCFTVMFIYQTSHGPTLHSYSHTESIVLYSQGAHQQFLLVKPTVCLILKSSFSRFQPGDFSCNYISVISIITDGVWTIAKQMCQKKQTK